MRSSYPQSCYMSCPFILDLTKEYTLEALHYVAFSAHLPLEPLTSCR
jgi:hypothetical protein